MTLCPFLRQCGYPHGSLSFLSSGNVMLLTLLTNEEKNFPGFRANYSQVPLTKPGTFGWQAARDRSRLTLPTTFSNTVLSPSSRLRRCSNWRQRLLVVTLLSCQLSSANVLCVEDRGESTCRSGEEQPHGRDHIETLWRPKRNRDCVSVVSLRLTNVRMPLFVFSDLKGSVCEGSVQQVPLGKLQ